MAAVVVFCLDEVEEFEVFEVVADSTVAERVFFVGLAEVLVPVVDRTGVDCLVLGFLDEFFGGLVEQLVVLGERCQPVFDGSLPCLVFVLSDVFFGDSGGSVFCGGFEPGEGVSGVLRFGGEVGQCLSV